MADVFTTEKRSRVMAAIKGKNTKSTELAIRYLLRSSKIRGWRFHPKEVAGNPDFAFVREKLAIFTDGCFWHGCRRCGLRDRAETNREFWLRKISGNIRRDRRTASSLKKAGWRVLRFWEHDIEKNPQRCLMKIKAILGSALVGGYG